MANVIRCIARFGLAAAAMVSVFETATGGAGQEPGSSGVGDPYPLATCVILGTAMDEGAEVLSDKEREIRLCCPECVDRFYEEHSTWITEIDKRLIRQQRPCYPLTVCVVDGAPLEGLGAHDFVFRNRLFRLCSVDCRRELEQHPAKYFRQLDKAVVEKQKPDYPLATCVVSGKPLGREAVDHVVANQLVRLCDSDQIKGFHAAPGRYLLEVHQAARKNRRTSREK